MAQNRPYWQLFLSDRKKRASFNTLGWIWKSILVSYKRVWYSRTTLAFFWIKKSISSEYLISISSGDRCCSHLLSTNSEIITSLFNLLRILSKDGSGTHISFFPVPLVVKT